MRSVSDALLAEDKKSGTAKREDPGCYTGMVYRLRCTETDRGEAKSPGSSRSLGMHSLPSRTLCAPSPACQSFQDPGQTKPLGSSSLRIQIFSSPVWLFPRVPGIVCTLKRTSTRALLCGLELRSHWPALKLRFHQCKVGTRAPTSRGVH